VACAVAKYDDTVLLFGNELELVHDWLAVIIVNNPRISLPFLLPQLNQLLVIVHLINIEYDLLLKVRFRIFVLPECSILRVLLEFGLEQGVNDPLFYREVPCEVVDGQLCEEEKVEHHFQVKELVKEIVTVVNRLSNDDHLV
jgi:hypothetical protein